MLNIAICEDNPVHSRKLNAMIETLLPLPFTIHNFASSREFLASCQSGICPYDLIFMDIELDKNSMNGIELSQEINVRNPKAQIIYITQHLEYVSCVYETSHTYFIDKEHLDLYLEKALRAALYNLETVQQQILHFKRQQKEYRIPQSDILYIERSLRISKINTRTEQFTCSQRLSDLMEQLTPTFVYCHRSFIVNLKTVKTLNRDEIILVTGQAVPVSRACYPEVKKAFAKVILEI
ncbi:MAG: LytTR family DNA-binding domain-containing protein [Eubacteriales bacterium]|nr:LytTR family DNA-binding domain-containing protein [Eubacteriales bacterium]